MNKVKLLLSILLPVIVASCGSGSGQSESSNPPVNLSEDHNLSEGLFEFVSNYEALNNISGARKEQLELEGVQVVGSRFSLLQSSSINQITVSAVLPVLNTQNLELEASIYSLHEGLPNTLVTSFKFSPHIRVLSKTNSTVSLNFYKEGMASLQAGDFILAIESSDGNFQWIPEHENHLGVGHSGGASRKLNDSQWSSNDWGRNIRLAGTCEAECVKANTGYVVGTDGADELRGDNIDNTFFPAQGNDVVYGGAGDDTYIYRLGDGELTIEEPGEEFSQDGDQNDRLLFGEGIHPGMLILKRNEFDLEINFYQREETLYLKKVFYDNSYDIEIFKFEYAPNFSPVRKLFLESASVTADWLVGDEESNRIESLEGNDVIIGHGGDDELFAGNNNDVLIGGEGADVLYGGLGIDTAAYYGSTSGVNVDFSRLSQRQGEAEGDMLDSIENIHGSQFNDEMYGDHLNNEILGFDGDDIIYGMNGSDVLKGGKGNDFLAGGLGSDVIYGGEGNDTIENSSGIALIYPGEGVDNITLGGMDNTVVLSGGNKNITGALNEDFYVIDYKTNSSIVADIYENPIREEINKILISGVNETEFWINQIGSKVEVKGLGKQFSIQLDELDKFEFYFDPNRTFLSALEEELESGSFIQIQAFDTALFTLSGNDFLALKSIMDGIEAPVDSDSVPLNISSKVEELGEVTSFQWR